MSAHAVRRGGAATHAATAKRPRTEPDASAAAASTDDGERVTKSHRSVPAGAVHSFARADVDDTLCPFSPTNYRDSVREVMHRHVMPLLPARDASVFGAMSRTCRALYLECGNVSPQQIMFALVHDKHLALVPALVKRYARLNTTCSPDMLACMLICLEFAADPAVGVQLAEDIWDAMASRVSDQRTDVIVAAFFGHTRFSDGAEMTARQLNTDALVDDAEQLRALFVRGPRAGRAQGPRDGRFFWNAWTDAAAITASGWCVYHPDTGKKSFRVFREPSVLISNFRHSIVGTITRQLDSSTARYGANAYLDSVNAVPAIKFWCARGIVDIKALRKSCTELFLSGVRATDKVNWVVAFLYTSENYGNDDDNEVSRLLRHDGRNVIDVYVAAAAAGSSVGQGGKDLIQAAITHGHIRDTYAAPCTLQRKTLLNIALQASLHNFEIIAMLARAAVAAKISHAAQMRTYASVMENKSRQSGDACGHVQIVRTLVKAGFTVTGNLVKVMHTAIKKNWDMRREAYIVAGEALGQAAPRLILQGTFARIMATFMSIVHKEAEWHKYNPSVAAANATKLMAPEDAGFVFVTFFILSACTACGEDAALKCALTQHLANILPVLLVRWHEMALRETNVFVYRHTVADSIQFLTDLMVESETLVSQSANALAHRRVPRDTAAQVLTIVTPTKTNAATAKAATAAKASTTAKAATAAKAKAKETGAAADAASKSEDDDDDSAASRAETTWQPGALEVQSWLNTTWLAQYANSFQWGASMISGGDHLPQALKGPRGEACWCRACTDARAKRDWRLKQHQEVTPDDVSGNCTWLSQHSVCDVNRWHIRPMPEAVWNRFIAHVACTDNLVRHAPTTSPVAILGVILAFYLLEMRQDAPSLAEEKQMTLVALLQTARRARRIIRMALPSLDVRAWALCVTYMHRAFEGGSLPFRTYNKHRSSETSAFNTLDTFNALDTPAAVLEYSITFMLGMLGDPGDDTATLTTQPVQLRVQRQHLWIQEQTQRSASDSPATSVDQFSVAYTTDTAQEQARSADAIVQLVARMESAATASTPIVPLDAVSEMYENHHGDIIEMFTVASTRAGGRTWFAEALGYFLASVADASETPGAGERMSAGAVVALLRPDTWLHAVHIPSLFSASQVDGLKKYLPPAWSTDVTWLLSGHYQNLEVML